MDNFLTWVDAPSEALLPTPMEDESNNYLRDEILQVQQFVIDKLDEQKINDTEDEDRSMDDSIVAQRIVSDMRVEAKRSEAVRKLMAGFQKECKSNELQMVSLKQNFPTGKVESVSYDKVISDMDYEVHRLQDQLESREIELRKRQNSMSKDEKSQERTMLAKLRESYVENKKKHEKLRALQMENLKIRNEYDQMVQRNAEESQILQTANVASQANEEKLEKLKEETVSMRAQLVHLESLRSKKVVDVKESEIERVKSEIEKIRKETADSRIKVDTLKASALELHKKMDGKNGSDLTKELEAETQTLSNILQKKLKEAKKQAKEEDGKRNLLELKASVGAEEAKLEELKRELAEMLPSDSKSVKEFKREISTMEANNRSSDRKIRQAVKENDLLIEEIAKHKGPTTDSFNMLNETIDLALQENVDVTLEIPPSKPNTPWKSAPRLPLDVTPIHARRSLSREKSDEVIIGIPPVTEWMTSTPIHKTRKQKSTERPETPQKQPPKKAVQTRAARRLAETQIPVTKPRKDTRKKKGKN